MEDEKGPDSLDSDSVSARVPKKGKAREPNFFAWSTRSLLIARRGERSPEAAGEEDPKQKEPEGPESQQHRPWRSDPTALQPRLPPPPLPSPLSTDPSGSKKIRELICDLYKEHNPSKLDEVDSLMNKYSGPCHEEHLYRGICAKYNVKPRSLPQSVASSSAEE